MLDRRMAPAVALRSSSRSLGERRDVRGDVCRVLTLDDARRHRSPTRRDDPGDLLNRDRSRSHVKHGSHEAGAAPASTASATARSAVGPARRALPCLEQVPRRAYGGRSGPSHDPRRAQTARPLAAGHGATARLSLPAPVAQGIERAPPEREVEGSIPSGRISGAVAMRERLETVGQACQKCQKCPPRAYPGAYLGWGGRFCAARCGSVRSSSD